MRGLIRAGATGCVLTVLLLAWTNLGLGVDGRIRSGQMLYEEHCFRCHGLTGHGDGPDADALTIKPANFHSPRIRQQSDFELWMSAAYGVADTPMHGKLPKLTEEELLDVLQYIRELAPPS